MLGIVAGCHASAVTSSYNEEGRGTESRDKHQLPFPPGFVLASGPDGIDVDSLRKLTNGSVGRMESKETVFLPFPPTLGLRAELLL